MAFKDKSKATSYINEFNKQKYDRITFLTPKGEKDIIKAVASRAGQSVNTYIYQAVKARMEAEGVSTDTIGGGTFQNEGEGAE